MTTPANGETLSLYQMATPFPDAQAARTYIESVRWPAEMYCAQCRATGRIRPRRRYGWYRCHDCNGKFSVMTNSVFAHSRLPLDKWLWAIYFLVAARKRISSVQLPKHLGIQQRSTWYVHGRFRIDCQAEIRMLTGIVEVDETYVGGREIRQPPQQTPETGPGGRGR